MTVKQPEPISLGPDDLLGWSPRMPVAMQLARKWALHAPRGTSAVPRWIGRRFGRNWRVVIETASGISLAVDPRHLDLYTWILRVGTPQPAVLETCLRLLRPGDVFYDIGASAGHISLSVARHFSGRVHVIGFEPQPELAHLTAVSAQLNRLENLTVFPVMLGASDGVGTLFVPRHSIHASAITRERGASALRSPLLRLDTLLETAGVPRPDVVKMDVEGSELDVLRGAGMALRENPPYVIFEADMNIWRFGYTRQDLFDAFSMIGEFEFFRIRPAGPVPIAEEDIDDFTSDNDFLAVPSGRLMFTAVDAPSP